MRLSKKFIMAVTICLITLFCVMSFIGCDNSNIVKDPKPYSFTNKPNPVAESDPDMTIDGVFDEERWSQSRWLYGEDRINSQQYANIDFTTSYGVKGVYFAINVKETGTNIWVNHKRETWLNSAIEMYMGPAQDGAGSTRTFEFDFLADGSYSAKLNYNGWSSAKTTYDKSPVIASKPIGGDINTSDCHGYTIEAFFPFAYLEFAGYDISNPDELILGIDPAHIFSFNYDGTDANGDRYWSQWSKKFIDVQWQNPSTFFHFGKNGLLAYEYTVKTGGTGKGSLREKSDWDYVLQNRTATFVIKPINGASVTKLMVNGVDCLNSIIESSGSYTFEVRNVSSKLEIDVEFA